MSYFKLVSASGVVYDFADDLHIIVQKTQGMGFPTPTNVAVANAITDGQVPQRQIYPIKEITLTCKFVGTSLANWHSLRRTLGAVVNRDVTPQWKPMYLRYSGSGTTYEIPVYYAGGLEITDLRVFQEFFPLKFVSYDPYWRAIVDSTAGLISNIGIPGANYILRKSANGAWSTLGGLNGEVFAVALDPATGYLWVGGDFTVAGSTTVNRVAYWDGSAWHAVNKVGVNGTVKAIAIGGGYVYVAGAFDQTASPATWMGGVARYNSDGTGVTALGSGVAAMSGTYDVRALALLPDGTLYVGGNFVYAMDGTAAPIANTQNIAKWNGSAWISIGNANYQVLTLVARGISEIYAGGIFTTIGGVSANKLARWNGTVWAALGSGVDDVPYSMVVGLDRNIYIGGTFLNADGAQALRICRWNGIGLFPLGGGLNTSTYDGVSNVRSMTVLSDGTLYVGGVQLYTAEGISLLSPLAFWNGSAFVPEDVYLPGGPSTCAVRGLASDASGNLYVGFSTAGDGGAPGQVIVINSGSARAYPTLTVSMTGGTIRIRGLFNYTTGDLIYMNYALSSGETLTLTLAPGNRSMRSSYYGDVSGYMLSSSDFATWSLLPGSNNIGLFINGETGSPIVSPAPTLTWRNRYWGAD